MAGWSLRNTVEGRMFWTAHKSQTVPLGKGVGERRHAQSAGPRVQCGGSRLRVERRLGERWLLGDRGSVNGATSMARTSSVKRRNTGPGIAPRLEVPQLLAEQTLALRGGEMHGAGPGGELVRPAGFEPVAFGSGGFGLAFKADALHDDPRWRGWAAGRRPRWW